MKKILDLMDKGTDYICFLLMSIGFYLSRSFTSSAVIF